MKLQDYIDRNFKHGTIHSVHYVRPVKTLKAYAGHTLEKETIGNYRIGCSYQNLSTHKGEQTGSLSYGEWEYSNEIIHSVTKSGEETYQLRLTTTGNSKIPAQVRYYLDGELISPEDLVARGVVGPSTVAPEQREVFNVKLDNIVEIK